MNLFLFLISMVIWIAFGIGLFRVLKNQSSPDWKRYKRLKRSGKAVHGTIVDYVMKKDGDGMSFYYPVIEFSTESDQIIRFTHGIGYGVMKKRTERFVVWYDQANPEDCVVDLRLGGILGYVELFIILPLIYLSIGAVIAFYFWG
jgi:hypothetical protein